MSRSFNPSGKIHILGDAKTLEEAQKILKDHALEYVKETSGADKVKDAFYVPLNVPNTPFSFEEKEKIGDGAFLVQVDELHIQLFKKKTVINRGWTYNTIDNLIEDVAEYSVVEYESTATPKESVGVADTCIKVQMCENCANRIRYEPAAYRRLMKDDGSLTRLIDELKENCKFIVQKRRHSTL